MQRKMFDSSVRLILFTCSLAKTLQSLAGQVNNLRVFLVDGYHDRFYTAKTNTEFIEIIYG